MRSGVNLYVSSALSNAILRRNLLSKCFRIVIYSVYSKIMVYVVIMSCVVDMISSRVMMQILRPVVLEKDEAVLTIVEGS
jgi:hypothetical protein